MQHATPTANKSLAVINIAVFLVMVTTNFLAVRLPLNNKTTGQLSDQYPNMFTPAGVTFSIWSVIYTFLAGFIIYQAVALFKNWPVANKIKSITALFVINGLANAGWLFAWHYEQVALSVAIMLVMLITLIIIHSRLQLALPWQPLAQKLWLDVPFSLYLGWISIATIANVTTLLVANSVEPFNISATYWTIILLIVATLLTLFMVLSKKNLVFGLVVCWALYGIVLKRQEVGSPGSADIIVTSQICIGIVALAMVISAIQQAGRKTEHRYSNTYAH